MPVLQAMKEKQTLEQQLRLDRRERQNTQLAAKNMHAKAQAELDDSRAEIERRNIDVETTVCYSHGQPVFCVPSFFFCSAAQKNF